jgi:hypothetical protein
LLGGDGVVIAGAARRDEHHQRSEWDAGCRFDFANPEYR